MKYAEKIREMRRKIKKKSWLDRTVQPAPFAKTLLWSSPLLSQLIFAHIVALPPWFHTYGFSCEHEIRMYGTMG